MNEDILATQIIINRQVVEGRIINFGIPFEKYQKVYGCTNENINGYVSQFDYNNKYNALSVMASGDHSFNLICNGILNIDTFDSNILTEYFALGIKRAAILAFNYQEYLFFLKRIFDESISLVELTDYITILLPYMEEKHKNYWKSIIDYNYNLQKDNNNVLNLFHMLLINIKNINKNRLINNYLLSEENYNRLKNNLGKANISFKECECLSLPNIINKNYDFILLSNIADYFSNNLGYNWPYEDFRKISLEFQKLLTSKGVVALAYIASAYSVYNMRLKNYLILNSDVKTLDLIDEEILLFDHITENKVSKTVKDAIILQRKL